LLGGDAEGVNGTFKPVDTGWVFCDFDDVRIDFDVDPSNEESLRQAGEAVLKLVGLLAYSCVLVWSSTAFFDAKTGQVAPRKAKCRVVFKLERPACLKAIKTFFKQVGADCALATATQPVYLASPRFEGFNDPLTRRLFLYEGDQDTLDNDVFDLYDTAEKEKQEQKLKAQTQAQTSKKKTAQTSNSTVKKNLDNLERWLQELENCPQGVGARNALAYRCGCGVGAALRGATQHEIDNALARAMVILDRHYNDKKKYYTQFAKGFEQGQALEGDFVRETVTEFKPHHPTTKKSEKKWKPDFFPTIPQTEKKTTYVLNASMGTGKTHAIGEFLSHLNKPRVLVIVPSKALALNTAKRYNATCYLDLQEESTFNYYEAERLTVCVDSIWRVRGEYDVVVCDEFHQICESLLKKQKNNVNFETLFSHLKRRFHEAKTVFIASANLHPKHLQIADKLGEVTPTIITHVSENPAEKWINLKNSNQLMYIAHEYLKRDQKIAYFCASLEQAKRVQNSLQRHNPRKKILAHHSEQNIDEMQLMQDVNSSWINYDVVIFTTTAGSGVDFSVEDHFDAVFLDGMGSKNLPYTAFEQASKRVRYPKESNIYTAIPDVFTKIDTDKEMIEKILNREKPTLALLGYEDRDKASIYNEIGKEAVIAFVKLSVLREQNSVCVWTQLKKRLESRGIAWVERDLEQEGVPKILLDDVRDELKGIKKELDEKKETEIINADELTESEADELESRDVCVEEKRALQKFHLQKFYEKTVDKTLIEQDKKGKTRKQINNRAEVDLFESQPDIFIERDKRDERGGKRSLADAKHHYLRAHYNHAAFTLLANVYPKLNDNQLYPVTLTENFDVVEEVKNFKERFSKTLTQKDLLPEDLANMENIQKFLGLLGGRLFGIKTVAKKEFIKDEHGKTIKDEHGKRLSRRVYSLDLENEAVLKELGEARQRRLRNEIDAACLDFESVGIQTIGFGGVVFQDNDGEDDSFAALFDYTPSLKQTENVEASQQDDVFFH
jgi:hypothetical protein